MADDARLHQSALSSIQRQAGAYHRTLKEQAIRPKTPLSLEDARRVVAEFVEHYNTVRLHSALGYVTPQDRMEGRHQEIYAARDRKLEAAREQRRQRRANLEIVL